MSKQLFWAATESNYDDYYILGIYTDYKEALKRAGYFHKDGTPIIRWAGLPHIEPFVVYDTVEEDDADTKDYYELALDFFREFYLIPQIQYRYENGKRVSKNDLKLAGIING